MSDHDMRVSVLDEKITALSNALAELGRGTTLQELLRIIKFPGYTTPAELAFSLAMVDSMAAQAGLLAKQQQDLIAAARQVVAKAGVAA
jgi:hypothetical protein